MRTKKYEILVTIELGMKLLSLPAWRRRTSDASVQRVVDENITIDAVKFFAFGTLEKIFV